MGSNTCRRIQLLGIAHPVEGKLFQELKAHHGMERVRGLRDEEMAICGLILYFCKKLGKRPNFG